MRRVQWFTVLITIFVMGILYKSSGEELEMEDHPALQHAHKGAAPDLFPTLNSALEYYQEKITEAKLKGDGEKFNKLNEELHKLYPPHRAKGFIIQKSEGPELLGPPKWGNDVIVHSGYLNNELMELEQEQISATYDPNTHSYYVVCATPDSLLLVYRSTDYGNTWDQIYQLFSLVGAVNEPSILLADTAIYIFYRNNNLFIYLWKITPSDFSTLYTVESDSDTIKNYEVTFDYPEYLTNYYLYLVYQQYNGGTGHDRIIFCRSTDKGLTWSHDSILFNGSVHPDIAFQGNENLFITFQYHPTSSYYGIYFKKNTLFGNASYWQNSTLLYSSDSLLYSPQIAATHNSNGTIWVIFPKSNPDNDIGLRYFYSPNGGSTWSSIKVLHSYLSVKECAVFATSPFIGSGDRVFVSWIAIPTIGDPHIRFAWANSANPDSFQGWINSKFDTVCYQIPETEERAIIAVDENEASVAYVGTSWQNVYFNHSSWTGIWEGEYALPVPQKEIRVSPNPFLDKVKIELTLDQTNYVNVSVYDLLGRHLKTLTRGLLKEGKYTLIWAGDDDHGQQLPSGIYYIVIKEGLKKVKRLVLKLSS